MSTRPAEGWAASSETLSAVDDAVSPAAERTWRARLTVWYLAAQPTLLRFWCLGAALLAVRLLLGFAQMLHLRRRQQPADDFLRRRTMQLAEQLRLQRSPRVGLLAGLRDAIVIGYLWPTILLPAAWALELPGDVLDAVLAHELAHIRRYDVWAILLQRLAELLFFYHPAVWAVSRQVSREREFCCDELAARAVGSPLDYVTALEHVARRMAGPKSIVVLSPNLGGRKMELLQRVQHLLSRDEAGLSGGGGRSARDAARLPHGPILAIVCGVLVTGSLAFFAEPANEVVEGVTGPQSPQTVLLGVTPGASWLSGEEEELLDGADDVDEVGERSPDAAVTAGEATEQHVDSLPDGVTRIAADAGSPTIEYRIGSPAMRVVVARDDHVSWRVDDLPEGYRTELRASGTVEITRKATPWFRLTAGRVVLLIPTDDEAEPQFHALEARLECESMEFTCHSLSAQGLPGGVHTLTGCKIRSRLGEGFQRVAGASINIWIDPESGRVDKLTSEGDARIAATQGDGDTIELHGTRIDYDVAKDKLELHRLAATSPITLPLVGTRVRPIGDTAYPASEMQRARDYVRRQRAKAAPTDMHYPVVEAKLLDGLRRPVVVDFVETPLEDALRRLDEQVFGGALRIDEERLRLAGVTGRTPVNLSVSGISLRSCLKLILEPLELDWIVVDGELVVTSRQAAANWPKVVVYTAGDLVTLSDPIIAKNDSERPARQVESLEVLADLIVRTIEPGSWETFGGTGTIVAHQPTLSLVIRAPEAVHQEVAELLTQLRRLWPGNDAKLPGWEATPLRLSAPPRTIAPTNERTAAERRIAEQLDSRLDVAFEAISLTQCLADVAERGGINIVVNEPGLLEAGVRRDDKVRLHLRDARVRDILDRLCGPRGLGWTIESEVVQVTSGERVSGGLTWVVHSLQKLIGDDEESTGELRRYADLIQQSIAPDSWDEHGGPGAIAVHAATKSLIVRQTTAIHRRVADLLSAIDSAAGDQQAVSWSPLPDATPTRAELVFFDRVREARVNVKVREQSLDEIVSDWSRQSGLNIVVDEAGLLEAGFDRDARLTLPAAADQLDIALKKLGDLTGLVSSIQGEVLVLTSPERAAGPMVTIVYPAALFRQAEADAVDLRQLAEAIQARVDAASWRSGGGSGYIAVDGHSQVLVITQSRAIHERLRRAYDR
ncbi:MAG: M56 family metallopeptidase [Planctomycetaceae bacterium]